MCGAQLGPSLEVTPYGVFWYPDFRVILLAAAFPSQFETVAYIAVFVTGHSGGAVLDFHQLPYRRTIGDRCDYRGRSSPRARKTFVGGRNMFADASLGRYFSLGFSIQEHGENPWRTRRCNR